MGRLPSFCLWSLVSWLCLLAVISGSTAAAAATINGGDVIDLVVDGSVAIASTDENFVCATLDWWPPEKCDYGTCSWGLSSLLNLNLADPILSNAVKALSPLRIRLGGTLQDKLIYETADHPCTGTSFVRNSSAMFGFGRGCLPLSRWDELMSFFNSTGAEIVFGLNALNGRVSKSGGSVGGPWDSTNARAFIRYTFVKGYKIYGWELGNELSGNGMGTRIGAQQYAEDMIQLRSIIDDVYQGSTTRPAVMAPGGFFDARWFTVLIRGTKRSNALDVLTHHIYNLGSGADEHLVDKILDPKYLDRKAATFRSLQNVIKNGETSAVSWVGEAGGAYNSGHHLVTDAFVFGFWYLDQLGMAAKFNTKSYCRQTLVGGHYGLLNQANFNPNPDYYSALLWHKLMGKNVLSANHTGSNKIRTYAHCAKGTGGITVVIIHLDGNTKSQMMIKHQPAKFAVNEEEDTREEYHLTARDGDLHSQTVLLNGNVLSVDSSGNIPDLQPIRVPASQPVDVERFSIVFVHVPYFDPPACNA